MTLTQVGVVVALGVLLGRFVVRSLLVPALTLEIGSTIWWPSKLRHAPAPAEPLEVSA